MKASRLLLAAALTLAYAPSYAEMSPCDKAYGQAVAACAQGLSAIPPSQRPGVQKACVEQAQLAKAQCLAPPPPFDVQACLNTCNNNWFQNTTQACGSAQVASANAKCYSLYGPEGTSGNDPDQLAACLANVIVGTANCVQYYTNQLNTCTQNCYSQVPQ